MEVKFPYDKNPCKGSYMTPYLHTEAKQFICDCISNYGVVYYPPEDTCHMLYYQGPCADNEYLVPPKNETGSSYCAKNPCPDGEVYFVDSCYPFRTFNFEYSAFLHEINVNEKTLELECRKSELKGDNYQVVPDDNCIDREGYHRRVEEQRKADATRPPQTDQPSAGGFIDAPRAPKYENSEACPSKGSKRNTLSICKRLI